MDEEKTPTIEERMIFIIQQLESILDKLMEVCLELRKRPIKKDPIEPKK